MNFAKNSKSPIPEFAERKSGRVKERPKISQDFPHANSMQNLDGSKTRLAMDSCSNKSFLSPKMLKNLKVKALKQLSTNPNALSDSQKDSGLVERKAGKSDELEGEQEIPTAETKPTSSESKQNKQMPLRKNPKKILENIYQSSALFKKMEGFGSKPGKTKPSATTRSYRGMPEFSPEQISERNLYNLNNQLTEGSNRSNHKEYFIKNASLVNEDINKEKKLEEILASREDVVPPQLQTEAAQNLKLQKKFDKNFKEYIRDLLANKRREERAGAHQKQQARLNTKSEERNTPNVYNEKDEARRKHLEEEETVLKENIEKKLNKLLQTDIGNVNEHFLMITNTLNELALSNFRFSGPLVKIRLCLERLFEKAEENSKLVLIEKNKEIIDSIRKFQISSLEEPQTRGKGSEMHHLTERTTTSSTNSTKREYLYQEENLLLKSEVRELKLLKSQMEKTIKRSIKIFTKLKSKGIDVERLFNRDLDTLLNEDSTDLNRMKIQKVELYSNRDKLQSSIKSGVGFAEHEESSKKQINAVNFEKKHSHSFYNNEPNMHELNETSVEDSREESHFNKHRIKTNASPFISDEKKRPKKPVVASEGLKERLMLDLTKINNLAPIKEISSNTFNSNSSKVKSLNQELAGFHQEFMSHIDEFSESWREAAMNERKRYND